MQAIFYCFSSLLFPRHCRTKPWSEPLRIPCTTPPFHLHYASSCVLPGRHPHPHGRRSTTNDPYFDVQCCSLTRYLDHQVTTITLQTIGTFTYRPLLTHVPSGYALFFPSGRPRFPDLGRGRTLHDHCRRPSLRRVCQISALRSNPTRQRQAVERCWPLRSRATRSGHRRPRSQQRNLKPLDRNRRKEFTSFTPPCLPRHYKQGDALV
jgi:hypothetical protein